MIESKREDAFEVLERMLETLIVINVEALAANPTTPSLYQSCVRYEPRNDPTWRDIPSILRSGAADSTELVAWRAAELRRQGVDAKGCLWKIERGPLQFYHTVVRHPDGHDEDPALLITRSERNRKINAELAKLVERDSTRLMETRLADWARELTDHFGVSVVVMLVPPSMSPPYAILVAYAVPQPPSKVEP